MFVGFTRSSQGGAKLAALDAIRANIMIADENLNITYMNAAAMALMREAEADLKRELPRFSVDALIGSNIDVFHKNPSHQRGMLARLDRPHHATIWVGKRAFDLLVSPLIDGGRSSGFVVEWSDAKPRRLNVDYANQIAAISRSQAVVEFASDGSILEANENFLRAVGYRIEDVRGRHHSMFVDPGQERTPEYLKFWEDLRRGEYQAAQFRRVSKSGKIVWIEGAYNPILDEQGKVSKIVKFATDITAQMALLGNLKRLIDENFGEIDRAIGLSYSEAASAAAAVAETSDNVSSVAASAEQLALSIGEISQSMAKSRSATENAFSQAVLVGKSTAAAVEEQSAVTQGMSANMRSASGAVSTVSGNITEISSAVQQAGTAVAKTKEAAQVLVR